MENHFIKFYEQLLSYSSMFGAQNKLLFIYCTFEILYLKHEYKYANICLYTIKNKI